jgi:integrase/recombinase XerD
MRLSVKKFTKQLPMSSLEYLNHFLHYLGVEKAFSPRTMQAYKHDLAKFFTYLESKEITDIASVTKHDIRAFLSMLAQDTEGKIRNAGITRARKLSAIKSLYKFLAKEGLVTGNPAIDIETPKIPEKEPCYLTVQEYEGLLRTIRLHATPYYHARDIAIVTTLLGTGIRLSELVGLNTSDIDLQDGLIKVLGKGNKERFIPLNEGVIRALNAYLPTRPQVDSSALFISRLGNKLSSSSVYHLVKKYLKHSGIQKEKLGVHSLRHSFGASLLDKNVNLVVIQQLMGHRKLETTRRYLHINNADLRTAVDKITIA